jgi:hypothetical protein
LVLRKSFGIRTESSFLNGFSIVFKGLFVEEAMRIPSFSQAQKALVFMRGLQPLASIIRN